MHQTRFGSRAPPEQVGGAQSPPGNRPAMEARKGTLSSCSLWSFTARRGWKYVEGAEMNEKGKIYFKTRHRQIIHLQRKGGRAPPGPADRAYALPRLNFQATNAPKTLGDRATPGPAWEGGGAGALISSPDSQTQVGVVAKRPSHVRLICPHWFQPQVATCHEPKIRPT